MWSTGYYGYLSDYLWWWAVPLALIVHTWCFFRITRGSTRRPKLRLVAGNLLIGSCLLATGGLIAETYLRFISVSTDGYGVTLVCKRWFGLIGPELNSLYCRDPEWSEQKPVGVRRIAFVGDSFTFGWGIHRVEDRATDLIQRRFDSIAPGRVEVMNVAWRGWDTVDELEAIRRMIAEYDVDEVVLCYLPNDIDKLIPKTERFDPGRPPHSSLINTDRSYLLDMLYYRIYAPLTMRRVYGYWDGLAEGFADPEIWRIHRQQLGEIVLACRAHGVRLRVALLPFIKTRGDKWDARAVHDRVASFFVANQVEVVDLLPVIAGRDPSSLVVSGGDGHPNEAANRLFADAVWLAFYADKGG